MKKPAIPSAPLDANAIFFKAVKECVEILIGRRGHKVSKITALESASLSLAPTAADYNALRNDLINVKSHVNDLLDRLQD